MLALFHPQSLCNHIMGLCFTLQKMPQEPRVLSKVRLVLDRTKETLDKMMPQAEFFKFLSAEALPQLEDQVGDHALEALRTITNVLNIQCEVSCYRSMFAATARIASQIKEQLGKLL